MLAVLKSHEVGSQFGGPQTNKRHSGQTIRKPSGVMSPVQEMVKFSAGQWH